MFGSNTLSWNEGSMGLRPEWPWRARRERISCLDESVQCWNLFLLPPPPAIFLFHTSSDQCWEFSQWFRRWSFNLQNSIAPSSSRGNCPCRRRVFNLFATGYAWSDGAPGSTSVHLLSPRGKVLVDEQAQVGLRGFAFAFDRLAKVNTSVFNAGSSVFVTEISCLLSSCSLSIKSVAKLFNPWEILTHEWEMSFFTDSILISTAYLPCRLLVVTSDTGPILVFPRIQPFGSVDHSSRGKVYSQHVSGSVNCENSSVSFVIKCCPTSTVFRNLASVQIFINRSCCASLAIRSFSARNFSCAGISIEGLGVILNHFAGSNNGSDCPANTGLTRSCLANSVFITQIWDCSIDTELINRKLCEKQIQSYLHRHRSVSIIFHLPCFWAFLGTLDVARKTGCPLSLNLLVISSATLSHSPRGLSM